MICCVCTVPYPFIVVKRHCHNPKTNEMPNYNIITKMYIFVSEGVIYDCPMCRLTFVDLKSLRGHVYSHAVNNIFYCPMCPLVCVHTFIVFHTVFLFYVTQKSLNCFYFVFYLQQFKTYKMIRKHIRARHHGLEFGCEYCNSSFNSRFNLNLHMLRYIFHTIQYE